MLEGLSEWELCSIVAVRGGDVRKISRVEDMDTNERIDIFYDYSAILSRLSLERAYAMWIFNSRELDTITRNVGRCTAARIKCSINTRYYLKSVG